MSEYLLKEVKGKVLDFGALPTKNCLMDLGGCGDNIAHTELHSSHPFTQ